MARLARIVVVGLGSIGRRHARLLAGRGDLDVEWCESSAAALESARQEMGEPAAVHASFEAVLETRPAMVVIATPHAMHAGQTVAALAAGIHVLCEKPMAETLANAERMAAAAERGKAVLTIGFHLHFHPGMRRLKALIREGELGSVHHAHCHFGSYIVLVNSKSRYQRTLEGALLLDCAHQPDIFAWLLERSPAGVYATGGRGGALEHQSDPNFIALDCDYASPLISTMHLNYLQMPERHEYEIVGDRGWALFDLAQGRLRIGRQSDSSERVEMIPTERDPIYRDEHAAFLDAVAGRAKPESPASSAMISMRIIAAALESLRSGQRVQLTHAQL
jgi:predicted dehydrogenase